MDNWISTPQFWAGNIVSGLTGVIVTYLAFTLVKAKGPLFFLLSKAKGRLRKYARYKRSKWLKDIKSIRFDGARVTRVVTYSYCILGLFWIGAASTVLSIMLAPDWIHDSRSNYFLYISAMAFPTLVMEWVWLNASTRASQVLRYRAKIKRKGRRMV